MSYSVQPPVAAPPAPAAGRPVPVSLASALLILMAVAGLIYAVATLVIAPGTVDRFRVAAAGAASADVDGFVSVIWIGAAIGTVIGVIIVALYVVLALGLRRGSNAARIATLVVCGLGLLAGCGSTVTVLAQRSGDGSPQSLGAALTGAYPDAWVGLNVGLAVAQIVGYLVVGLLLFAARGAWFGRGPAPAQPPAPGWGPTGPGASGYGYGPGAPGYSYGTPYGSGQPPTGPGWPPTVDQAYQPGARQGWSPGQGVQPSGMPPGTPPGSGQPPTGPSGVPPRGPEDDYWSRPTS